MTADWLDGAVDVHVHTAPDLVERYETDLALAREVADSPMAGAVVKSHIVPTVGRVDLINEAVGDDVLIGGIALNGTVGGINPDAVAVALALGADLVWLPTAWSRNHARQARAAGVERFVGQRVPGPEEDIVVAEDGTVTDDTREVIELVADAGAVLGTGHVSPSEIEAVVDACAAAGATCLVNHPFFRVTDLSISQQAALAECGAVMEYCRYAIQSTDGHSITRVAEAVERIGPDKCVLATDFGQAENPPVSGLREFAAEVHEAGVERSAVRQAVAGTPQSLLGLE